MRLVSSLDTHSLPPVVYKEHTAYPPAGTSLMTDGERVSRIGNSCPAKQHFIPAERSLIDRRPPELFACTITRSVMRSRPADTNFYACSSRRRIRLQADVIINRIVKTLLAPEVSLRRLN